MKLESYLQETFPNLELVPSLYHQWERSIHFSLAEGIPPFLESGDRLNDDMFQTAYEQIRTLFHELFDEEDELFVVANLYREKEQRKTVKLKVYERHVKDSKMLKTLTQKTWPYPFEDEENAFEMLQFTLSCQIKDLHMTSLLKGTLHEDFPLKPRFATKGIHYPDLFFVNQSKDVILFIYDDRGCEVLAKDPEILRTLYREYRNWVEPYEREVHEKKLGLSGTMRYKRASK